MRYELFQDFVWKISVSLETCSAPGYEKINKTKIILQQKNSRDRRLLIKNCQFYTKKTKQLKIEKKINIEHTHNKYIH